MLHPAQQPNLICLRSKIQSVFVITNLLLSISIALSFLSLLCSCSAGPTLSVFDGWRVSSPTNPLLMGNLLICSESVIVLLFLMTVLAINTISSTIYPQSRTTLILLFPLATIDIMVSIMVYLFVKIHCWDYIFVPIDRMNPLSFSICLPLLLDLVPWWPRLD